MANELKMVNGVSVELTDSEMQELIQLRADEKEKLAKRAWKDNRIIAYGRWQDQLDEIFHDVDAWRTRIAKVKTDNPKYGG
tara:strand:- start:12 stop:254 length:243 start_codon:yes stop_codon:yes gene_type:complete